MSDIITQVQKGHDLHSDDSNDVTLIDFGSKSKDKKRSWLCWCLSKPKGGYHRELDNMNEFRESSHQLENTKSYLLPPQKGNLRNKKCLVLDLDETLVHSSFKPVPNADFIVHVEIERVIHDVYVLKRPHVDEFLKSCGKHFEVVIFTASLSKYADPVLDLLDTSRVISSRLFRESCSPFKGNYVKDLSLMGRPMNSCIIVDNSPYSYLFQPENAFPVTSWFDDPNDTELLDMIPYLEKLATCDDVVVTLDKFKRSKGFTFGRGLERRDSS